MDTIITIIDDEAKSCADNNGESIKPRRSLRKPIRPLAEANNDPVKKSKSKKLTESSSKNEIEKYYLNDKVRLSQTTSLETIFEEPKNDLIMNNRKLTRRINFPQVLTTTPHSLKVKKRSMKAKKLDNHFKVKMKKLNNIDIVMEKLKELE